MAWYGSLYTTFMHTIYLIVYIQDDVESQCWCVWGWVSALTVTAVCTLSFSHTCTHSLYCNVNLSSHTFAFIWQKSCWDALLFLLTQLGEMPAHTHTHTPLTVIFFPFYLFIRKGSYEKLWLKIKFGRGHYDIWICVCVQISVRWSCVSWLTCQLTHSCWESFRTLKQMPSPCWQPSGGYTLPYISVYNAHTEHIFVFVLFCFFFKHACFQCETSLGSVCFFHFF